MSPLKLPAADAPAEEWGRLAVSLPGWRWKPGMLEVVSGWRWDGHSFLEQGVRYPQAGNCISGVPELLPDPDDPSGATAGCLRALLGKRLHIEHGTYLARVVVLQEPAVNGLYPQGEQRNLGRAAIAAAAAVGRWPGGGA